MRWHCCCRLHDVMRGLSAQMHADGKYPTDRIGFWSCVVSECGGALVLPIVALGMEGWLRCGASDCLCGMRPKRGGAIEGGWLLDAWPGEEV